MLEMLHNLNLSTMFMTENITTEALNTVFLISELTTVLSSFGRATIDGLLMVMLPSAHILEQPVEISSDLYTSTFF